MKRPIIYIAITNHGFGHATRTASIANTIQKLCPEVLLIIVTTAPRWLLESYIEGDFILRQRAFDLGVIQADSLTMDKPATLEKLREIKKNYKSLIASEVNFIRQNRVNIILADIPLVTLVGILSIEIGGENLQKLLIGLAIGMESLTVYFVFLFMNQCRLLQIL
jgi:hypothetical protein